MFYGFVITESGNALLASMVAGQTLTITKAVVGEGTADNPDTARKLTNLITPGPTATSTKPTVDGNSVNMIVEYRSDLNGGLQEGFWIGEFGIFGKVEDGEETMIGYGSLGDARQYVSAYVEGTAPDVRRYPVSITVTTGTKVEVSYPAEAWMTAEDVDDKVNKHNSSEESHKDIRAALSNKVTITGNNMAGLDCNNFISDGRYQCQGEVLNSPPWHPGSGYGHFFVDVYHHADSWIVQVAHAVDHIGSFIRHCIGGTWQEWEKIATATPPQGYDLPLEIGWDVYGICKYWLTQDGMCFVNIGAHATSPPSTEQVVLATLPEGFRPNANVYAPACVSFPRAPGDLQINPSGQIIYTWATLENETYISAFFGFLVNQ